VHAALVDLATGEPPGTLCRRVCDDCPGDVEPLLLRPISPAAMALCLARRDSGDSVVAARDLGRRLVCGQYGTLQRDVRVGRGWRGVAGLDVLDGFDFADWV